MVAVAGVPGDSTTFYFGAVNGGVWKTTDAGTVWTPIFDNQPVASIGAIAVAPSDPKIDLCRNWRVRYSIRLVFRQWRLQIHRWRLDLDSCRLRGHAPNQPDRR